MFMFAIDFSFIQKPLFPSKKKKYKGLIDKINKSID